MKKSILATLVVIIIGGLVTGVVMYTMHRSKVKEEDKALSADIVEEQEMAGRIMQSMSSNETARDMPELISAAMDKRKKIIADVQNGYPDVGKVIKDSLVNFYSAEDQFAVLQIQAVEYVAMDDEIHSRIMELRSAGAGEDTLSKLANKIGENNDKAKEKLRKYMALYFDLLGREKVLYSLLKDNDIAFEPLYEKYKSAYERHKNDI